MVGCGGSVTEEATEEPAPVEEPVEEPMDEPTEEPMDEPMDEPTEEPMDEPMGPAAGELGSEDNPIVWVLVPSQDTEAVLSGADEIAAVIEEQTGYVIVPLVTTDFTGAVEAMCNGEAHMGALNTFNYVLANARGCADVSIASVRFGSTFYSGQVVAHVDSGITSV
ncbi:MAG: PhnD/SsuA/transferrin family substrate-binding protein, partial [Gammaproteobacteria bacterium]|nr:PhnD/SsuA/transferrin family substrate-binding protein [Gammaproteobacteria bacterium]